MTYGAYAYGVEPYAGLGATLGALPVTWTVLVDFTSAPTATTPTWTDISEYAGNVTVNRGKSGERDRVRAGTATVELTNIDRRFDPTYASSLYYPNIKPMRRVRILGQVAGGVTYAEFDGYIDAWVQTYDDPGDATCVLQATDAFKILSSIDTYPSVYWSEVVSDAPLSWYRLDDAQGTTAPREKMAGRDAAVFVEGSASVTFGQSGMVSRDPGTSVKVNPFVVSGSLANRAAIQPPTTAIPTGTGDFTIEFIIDDATNNSSDAYFLEVTGAGTDNDLRIGVSSGVPVGAVVVNAGMAGGGFFAGMVGSTLINDGNPHHIALVRAGGLATLYVDGVAQGSLSLPITLGPTLLLGSTSTNPNSIVNGALFSNLAMYTSALSAARILAHHDARKVGGQWNGDTTGARIIRMLDLAGWPASRRSIDTGVTTLQSATPSGSVLDYIQKVADTEQGDLFMTGDGTLRFVSRQPAYSQAPSATFGDSPGELEYQDVTFDYADSFIFNDIQVSRENGLVQRRSDASSQSSYLKRSLTLDGLLTNSDTDTAGLADFLLNTYKDPQLRPSTLSLRVLTDTTLAQWALAIDIGTIVQVRRIPQNLGSAIDVRAQVLGIRHQVRGDGKLWSITYQLSSAGVQFFLQLDAPITGPSLGSAALSY